MGQWLDYRLLVIVKQLLDVIHASLDIIAQ